MIVLCIENTGENLSEGCLALGNTKDSIFHVSIGSEYQVFAISIRKSVIFVLLSDDTNLPNWHPIELFSKVDASLPEDWAFFNDSVVTNQLQVIIGYRDLIYDLEHYDALIEREPEALKIFFKEQRKREDLTGC